MFEKINSLTKRESEIFNLILDGHDNPEIAEKLFISRSTVETHRKNMHRKLGTHSTFDILKCGFEMNII